MKTILNHEYWVSPDTTRQYAQAMHMQFPEVMILVRYKEEIAGKRILDIGCGAGRTAYVLKRIAGSYIGIDYSQKMIDYCRKRFVDGDFRQVDVRTLDAFESNTVDVVVFSFNGIDCLDHEARLVGLREIHRVLKPQQLFIFSSHNRNYPYDSMKPRLSKSLNPITQINSVVKYIVQQWRHHKNQTKAVAHPDYAIIRSNENAFDLLQYAITKEAQIRQLQDIGFGVIDMYTVEGERLHQQSPDAESLWIYYVARKNADS